VCVYVCVCVRERERERERGERYAGVFVLELNRESDNTKMWAMRQRPR
jgi:hypothetical protein